MFFKIAHFRIWFWQFLSNSGNSSFVFFLCNVIDFIIFALGLYNWVRKCNLKSFKFFSKHFNVSNLWASFLLFFSMKEYGYLIFSLPRILNYENKWFSTSIIFVLLSKNQELVFFVSYVFTMCQQSNVFNSAFSFDQWFYLLCFCQLLKILMTLSSFLDFFYGLQLRFCRNFDWLLLYANILGALVLSLNVFCLWILFAIFRLFGD